jgi:hypothetical protein
MNGTINISFRVELKKYVRCDVEFSEINKEIIGERIPFLLVGYTENLYTKDVIRVNLNENEKNYKVSGSIRIKNTNKIRPDTKLLFQLYNYVTNDDDFPVTQRVSEDYVYLTDMLKTKYYTLMFYNKDQLLRASLDLDIVSVNYDSNIFEDESKQIYDTQENSKRIDEEVAKYTHRTDMNRKNIFIEYTKNTKNMVFEKSFEFYKFGYSFSYLDARIGKTNEEFWENLLYMCIQGIWLESGKKFNLKGIEITSEKKFRAAMQTIFGQFTLHEKLNVMTDMFAAISVNTPYTPDFSVNKNGKKIKNEDFFEIDMGYGDCDDLSKYIMICVYYFKSITFTNEILRFMRKILHYYVPFLALTSASCSASYNCKGKNIELSAHLSSPWILKSWLFEETKSDNEEIVVGKILANMFVDSTTSEEILEDVKKIIKYEKNIGNLVREVDGEALPTLLILDGTGKFNSTADKNPIKKQCSVTDGILGKNEALFDAFSSKCYATVDNEFAFYQNFHVMITKFFMDHVQHPTNIPAFTLTNHKVKRTSNNQEEYEENEIMFIEYYSKKKEGYGYNYGESYPNLVNGCEKTRFMCNVPLVPFKQGLEISKSISNNKINTQDLLLLKKTEDKILFKPKYVDNDKDGNPIEAESITPMLPLKTLLKLDKIILSMLNKTSNSNYKSLKESEYAMCSTYMKENNQKKIVIYDVKCVDMYKYVEEMFDLCVNNENAKIVAVCRNDISINLGNYRVFMLV